MIKNFVKFLVVTSVVVASFAVRAETKVTVNAKSQQDINAMCESVGRYGGKIFEELAQPDGGRASELMRKAKDMDTGTGLLMVAAAKEAIRHFADVTKDHGLYAREVEVQKKLAETAATLRCHTMVVPKFK